MRVYNSSKCIDVNHGITASRSTPGAILLDVRSVHEYREGHIPGSQNLPLQFLEEVDNLAEEKDVPLFVYCRSGSRSYQATAQLLEMGYTNVNNIGGIAAYTGRLDACQQLKTH